MAQTHIDSELKDPHLLEPLKSAREITKGVLLFGILTLTLFTSTRAESNKGTVELGFDFSAEKNSGSDSDIEFPVRIRVGTFLTQKILMETHLNFNFLSGKFEMGGALGFNYHFQGSQNTLVPYFGPYGELTRQKASFMDQERFGLGLKLGVKTLKNKTSPRLEVFALQRFKNEYFPSDVLIGLNLGFSIFFISNSPWDK